MYNKKSTRAYSSRQERAVAKTLGGRVNPNSGAAMFYSGDVPTNNFMIECKTRVDEKFSITIKREWIEKSKEEAISMGKPNWAICFDFGTPHDSRQMSERYYIISEQNFKRLSNGIDKELI